MNFLKNILGNTKGNLKKKIKKKLLLLLLSPPSLIILMIIFLLAGIGAMGSNTVNGTLSETENKKIVEDLDDYLRTTINVAKKGDSVAEQFFVTKGNVIGYIQYVETREGKDITKVLNKPLTECTHYYARKFKPKFSYSTVSTKETVKKKAQNSLEGDSTENYEGSTQVLTHISSIYGEIDIKYKQDTVTYTDKDGEHTETKPVYDSYELKGDLFDRLKKIIKHDYPDEPDMNMAIAYVINSSLNFDKQEFNGDWITKKPNEFKLEDLISAGLNDGEGGTFDGLIPYFAQYDPKWASYPYAGSYLRRSGCGACCFAMVATGLEAKLGKWDKNKDKILTPNEAADFSHAHGCDPNGCGTIGTTLYASISELGIKCRHYNKSQYQQVLKELQNGCPVIANVHGSESIAYGSAGSTFTQHGHFIVLKGIDSNGKIKVLDPGNANNNDKLYDFKSIIVAETSDFWAFNNPEMSSNNLSRNYKYRDIKHPDKIKNYIQKASRGHMADEPHFSTVVKVAKKFNLNPFILFAIGGAEQSFATKRTNDYTMVIKNPYNVFHSWKEYHPGLERSSEVACRTVINMAKQHPDNNKNLFYRIGKPYVCGSGWREWAKNATDYFDIFTRLDK